METHIFCGLEVAHNTKIREFIAIPSTNIKIPITIINGEKHGPIVLATAGIHGGEYPGIAAAIELGRDFKPEDISGILILIHPVNIQAFWARSSEITPEDGKNLNREFPGDHNGTLAQKISYFLEQEFQKKADFYIDMHSGDIHEDLHPYVYYPGVGEKEIIAKSKEIAQVLDVEYMVKSTATTGAYNYAALNGTPSILVERGGNGFCCREDIDAYKDDILHILDKLKSLTSPLRHHHPHRFTPKDVKNVQYVAADRNFCWFHNLHSGSIIKKGDIIGTSTDLFGTIIKTYIAESDGVLLYITPALAVNNGTILFAYGEIEK